MPLAGSAPNPACDQLAMVPASAPYMVDDVRCQAHDLKNKLQVVVGYCDVLLAPAGPPADWPRAARMIGQIRAAAQDSARLASAIMSPPSTSAAARALDLDALLLDEVTALVPEMLRAGINVHLERATGVPPVRVDGPWLARTLLNLAYNARDAIVAQPARTGTGLIRFRVSRPALATPTPCVMLSVADNGPGMDADALARIWDAGHSTKGPSPDGAPRGFGLASVRAFALEAGGMVNVYSEPGEGTEFALFLPAAEPWRRG